MDNLSDFEILMGRLDTLEDRIKVCLVALQQNKRQQYLTRDTLTRYMVSTQQTLKRILMASLYNNANVDKQCHPQLSSSDETEENTEEGAAMQVHS